MKESFSSYGQDPVFVAGERAEFDPTIEKLQHMKGALIDYVAHPIEKDPRIKAYREGLLQLFDEENELVTDTFYQYLKNTQDTESLPPIYATNIALRGFQMLLLREENLSSHIYPEDFTTPDVWKHGIIGVLSDKNNKSDFIYCIEHLKVQSNIADRYKSLKLLLHLYGHRFLQDPHVIDVGCSQNLGLKLIAYNTDFSSDTKLLNEIGENSQNLNAILQRLLTLKAPLGHSFGVDLFSDTDKLIQEWTESCSFYPSELLDEKRLSQFRNLTMTSSNIVDFIWTDFIMEHSPQQECRYKTELPPPGSMDIVVLSTVLYQHSPEERIEMIQKAKDQVSDNGLLLVQDFVSVDPNDPNQLDFGSWYGGGSARTSGDLPYKTFVYDKTLPSEVGFQLFLEWSDGRCESVRLGPLAREQFVVAV